MTARSDDTTGTVLSVELPAVAAGDTSTVLVPASVPFDGYVTRVDLVPRAAITANGTNFGTITVQDKGVLGSGNTAVASRSWAATNSVAGTKELATLNATPANREVKAGDQLQVVHTTAGTGLALPAISVLITFLAR